METYRKLWRDRTILKSLYPTGKGTVRRKVLAEMEFDSSIFTTHYIPVKTTYFSGKYGYIPLREKSQ